MPETIRVGEDNYDWLDEQRQQLSDGKHGRVETFREMFDRWRKERGKD